MGFVQACKGELHENLRHFWSLTLCTQWPLYRMLIRAWLVDWRAWSWAGTIGVLKLLLHSLSSAWDAEGVPICNYSVCVRYAQVVLCRNKKEPSKYAALKVVFLQSPQVVDDPDHLAIMKQCAFAQRICCHARLSAARP